MTKMITAAAAAALCAVAIGACGDDDETTKATTSSAAGGVEVTDAWSRVTAPSQTSGAVYMTITAPGGDTLTKASVPASIAKKTELHETTDEGGSTDDMIGGDTDHSAMKAMKPVSSIGIPAGKTTKLEPGGYHVMLLELSDPITEGEKIPVTLTFEKAGTVEVEATARES